MKREFWSETYNISTSFTPLAFKLWNERYLIVIEGVTATIPDKEYIFKIYQLSTEEGITPILLHESIFDDDDTGARYYFENTLKKFDCYEVKKDKLLFIGRGSHIFFIDLSSFLDNIDTWVLEDNFREVHVTGTLPYDGTQLSYKNRILSSIRLEDYIICSPLGFYDEGMRVIIPESGNTLPGSESPYFHFLTASSFAFYGGGTMSPYERKSNLTSLAKFGSNIIGLGTPVQYNYHELVIGNIIPGDEIQSQGRATLSSDAIVYSGPTQKEMDALSFDHIVTFEDSQNFVIDNHVLINGTGSKIMGAHELYIDYPGKSVMSTNFPQGTFEGWGPDGPPHMGAPPTKCFSPAGSAVYVYGIIPAWWPIPNARLVVDGYEYVINNVETIYVFGHVAGTKVSIVGSASEIPCGTSVYFTSGFGETVVVEIWNPLVLRNYIDTKMFFRNTLSELQSYPYNINSGDFTVSLKIGSILEGPLVPISNLTEHYFDGTFVITSADLPPGYRKSNGPYRHLPMDVAYDVLNATGGGVGYIEVENPLRAAKGIGLYKYGEEINLITNVSGNTVYLDTEEDFSGLTGIVFLAPWQHENLGPEPVKVFENVNAVEGTLRDKDGKQYFFMSNRTDLTYSVSGPPDFEIIQPLSYGMDAFDSNRLFLIARRGEGGIDDVLDVYRNAELVEPEVISVAKINSTKIRATIKNIFSREKYNLTAQGVSNLEKTQEIYVHTQSFKGK